MTRRDHALKQIEEIGEVMRNSFTMVLPASLFIAIGCGLLVVPFCEMFFSRFIDAWIFSLCGSDPFIFVLRTIFYWTSFTVLSRLFVKQENVLHPAIKRAWALNSFFPLIPLSTAAMLYVAGYVELISPIVMILIGLYFALIGRFAQGIVSFLAGAYVLAGLGSIYLASIDVPHLWYGTLWFQGLACVVTGLVLRLKNHD